MAEPQEQVQEQPLDLSAGMVSKQQAAAMNLADVTLAGAGPVVGAAPAVAPEEQPLDLSAGMVQKPKPTKGPLDTALDAVGDAIESMPGPGTAIQGMKQVYDWAAKKNQEISTGKVQPSRVGAFVPEMVQDIGEFVKGESTPNIWTGKAPGDPFTNLRMMDSAAANKMADKLKAAGHTNTANALKVAAGISEGGIDFVHTMSNPKNLALAASLGNLRKLGMLGTTVESLVNAGFSYKMITDAFSQSPEVKKAIYNHDWEEASRLMTDQLATFAMGGLAAKGAVEAGAKPYEAVKEKIFNPWTKAGADAAAVKSAAGAGAQAPVGTPLEEDNLIPEKVQGVAPSEHMKAATDKIYRAIKPGKAAVADDFRGTLEEAMPQLSVIANKTPDVSNPVEMADAIEKHRLAIEGQLSAKAEDMRGIPEAKMEGIRDAVGEALDNAFERAGKQFTPEEAERAKKTILNQYGEEDPDLYDANQIRKRFNEDTRPAFMQPPGTVPSAEVFAKTVANEINRVLIDQKFDELGVPDSKEWRGQEAALISVRDALQAAAKRSEDAGQWNAWDAFLKRKGWGGLFSIVGAITGGAPGAILGEMAHLGLDWWRDQKTNPNVLSQKGWQDLIKAGPSPEAAIPKKVEAPAAPAIGQPQVMELKEPTLEEQADTEAKILYNRLAPTGMSDELIAQRVGSILRGRGYPTELARAAGRAALEKIKASKIGQPQVVVPPEGEEGFGTAINSKTGAAEALPAPMMTHEFVGEAGRVKLAAEGKEIGRVNWRPEKDGTASVTAGHVEPQYRGKGLGQKMYLEAAKQAKAAGAPYLTSDLAGTTSMDAARVWDALKEKGYPVEQIPSRIGTPGYRMDLSKLEEPKIAKIGQPEARPMEIPKNVLPEGHTTESVLHHEWGHVLKALDGGIPVKEIWSHSHPEAGKGSAATAFVDYRQLKDAHVDSQGRVPMSDIADVFLENYAPMFLGGAVANEVIDGIPFAKNYGLQGDISNLKTGLKYLKYTPAQMGDFIDAQIDRGAKDLTGDPALGILKKYAGEREEGLPDTHIASEDRVKQFWKDVQEARRGTKYERGPAGLRDVEGPGEPSPEILRSPEARRAGAGAEGDIREGDREKVPARAAPVTAGLGTAAGLAALAGRKREEPEAEPVDLSAGLAEEAEPKAAPVARKAVMSRVDILDMIDDAARENNIPVELLRAQAKQESGFRQEAISPKGARGVLQLMPETAAALGVDPEDTEQNIRGGAKYMGQLYDRFRRWDQALAAYDWGADRVEHAVDVYGDRWLEHTPDETKSYVKSILGKK